MSSNKIIGFWGLSFNSGNMGCNALSYSFLSILNNITMGHIQVYVFFQGSDFDTSSLSTEKVSVISAGYNPRSIDSIKALIKCLKKCDISIDFTAGDSFSDIYGLKGFLKSCAFKKLAMIYSKKFILGPQTYGPYTHWIAQSIAKHIIRKADYACSRDAASAEYVKALCGIDIDIFTDVAFALPYKNHNTLTTTKKKIGINVSGLLWNGGYTGDNQFSLTVDYRTYITAFIESLLQQNDVEIYIIPHVISSVQSPESDYPISEQLAAQYTAIHLAPRFTTPIEAKDFIAEMDVFTGARMHATIGAFSAGVVTIPFSYSRKFEGLYNSLNYPYTINARELDTSTAIQKTLEYINNSQPLKTAQERAFNAITDKLNLFEKTIQNLLNNDNLQICF